MLNSCGNPNDSLSTNRMTQAHCGYVLTKNGCQGESMLWAAVLRQVAHVVSCLQYVVDMSTCTCSQKYYTVTMNMKKRCLLVLSR